MRATTLTPALSLGERGRRAAAPRGFSLVEVLLAIFILGIGVISITALFPAGIAQQRRSTDDLIGPIVADSALEVIRSKVRPEDFGTFEDFGFLPDFLPSTPASDTTVPGDWPWRRPGFFLDPAGTTVTLPSGSTPLMSAGSITIFNSVIPDGTSGVPNPISEIPWNPYLYGSGPPGPFFIITQSERYYPQSSSLSGQPPARPQYVWDCMFRRFGGKILVAIFVYRANFPGGGTTLYVVPPNPGGATSPPPLPVSLDLVEDPATGAPLPFYSAMGPWDSFGLTSGATPEDDNVVAGTNLGSAIFNPQDPREAWQVGGQWLIDQNNNVHRVLSADPTAQPLGPGLPTAVRVELVRAPPAYTVLNFSPPGSPLQRDVFFYEPAPPSGLVGAEDVVTNIWYIPTTIGTVAGSEFTLTPVYATVREL